MTEHKEIRIKFDIAIPADIQQIQQAFSKYGHKLYVVGGAVRDALLNKHPKDFDLATDAIPDKVEFIMKESGFRTLPTGKAFGVINVFTQTGEYEIATFRIDLSSGRRPDGVEFTDIMGDVKRRDLTINALFYDLETHEVVDLVGGIEDLKNGIVRTVGAAEDRFGEDRLRILRAIRFAGRFGSELEPSVDAALTKDASLEGISAERIRDEFIKGIQTSKSVVHYLQLLKKYDLFNWIFKGLSVNDNFIETHNEIVVIATLLNKNDSRVLPRTLNKLTYTDVEIKGIKFLIDLLQLNVDNAFIMKKQQSNARITPQDILLFSKFNHLDQKLIDAFNRYDLTVSGDDVMTKFNLPAGKELGLKIQQLEKEKFMKLLG